MGNIIGFIFIMVGVFILISYSYSKERVYPLDNLMVNVRVNSGGYIIEGVLEDNIVFRTDLIDSKGLIEALADRNESGDNAYYSFEFKNEMAKMRADNLALLQRIKEENP